MNRFDYVKYDEKAIKDQELFEERVMILESDVDLLLESPRAKALALTKLGEFYTWVGKAIRDDQFKRTGSAPLQEERTDS